MAPWPPYSVNTGLGTCLTLLLVASNPGRVTGECAPGCTGKHGAFLPDVTHDTCTAYYYYFYGVAIGPCYCERSDVFIPEVGGCDPDTYGTFTCSPLPECPVSDSENCQFECEAASTLIADRTDCSLYYGCSGGEIGDPQFYTGDTSFFDVLQCQTDESKCCSCHPYCPRPLEDGEPSYLVPDMTNCRRAYECSEEDVSGIPDTQITCPPSMSFDPVTSQCSYTAKCVLQCTNVVGPDGCIEIFTCQTDGFFSKCPQLCCQEFYYCSEENHGHYVLPSVCPGGKYFRLDIHDCVDVSECGEFPPVTPQAAP